MKKAILHKLFVMELQDLYSAEQQLLEAIPKMADAANHPDLKLGLEKHLQETEEQAARLEEIAEDLDFEIEGEECMGMKGVIKEGDEVIKADLKDDRVADAALIGAAQRVEHYEMAGYGTAVELAKQMGHTAAAKLLQQTLDEEGKADKTLTKAAADIYKEIEE